MTTNLYLVRHAHSTYTPDELGRPLSVQGLKDAETVTKLLKNVQVDKVISSPYKRAKQTVEGIAEHIGQEIEMMDAFKERRLAEESVEDFHTAIAKVWEDETFSWKGGESNLVAQRRGVEAIHQLLKKYNGKSIVIGTHGNIMVLIMNYFDQSYNFKFWQELEMPDIYQLTFNEEFLIRVRRVWEGNY
ncbi:histidine phosphatase family protein [Salinibacillus xinjiangensis]|uniref:Histidine phosphatase family protein n=1 Tax=Salinibacillus xinjiangensis TaxID=1229268 RepID=A0A6G1X6S7_9BACI|nr:histidine phosphatase family protein [Salinibacillus xinjiangensis]MRG86642.1 histidine phosphatase family protein [Salinibacillus xinjiangensis]